MSDEKLKRPKHKLSEDKIALLTRMTRPSGVQKSPWFRLAQIYLLLMAVSVVALLNFGRNLNQSFDNAISPSPFPIASRNVAACRAPAVVRPETDKFRIFYPEIAGDVEHEFGKFVAIGEFVECLMRTNPERLCVSVNREALIADIRTYQKFYDAITVTRQSLQRPLGNTREAVLAQMMASEVLAARQLLERIEYIDADVLNAIRSVSKKGVLSTKDFGWFGYDTPTHIARALELTAPSKSICE